jgi:hypothetical protein
MKGKIDKPVSLLFRQGDEIRKKYQPVGQPAATKSDHKQFRSGRAWRHHRAAGSRPALWSSFGYGRHRAKVISG